MLDEFGTIADAFLGRSPVSLKVNGDCQLVEQTGKLKRGVHCGDSTTARRLDQGRRQLHAVDNAARLFYKRLKRSSRGGSMSGLIWWLIVGGIAGLLAGVVMKGGGYGVIADIILGILGAFVGGWLFGLLGLGASGGMIGSIIVAFIGACILIGITRMLKRA
jgi:uncharacterized membrane protein YeaQ/YmgE (transglycosylase-associated protein family)